MARPFACRGRDRNAPADEQWSLAVKDGKALEERWREEPPIPRGGHHRAGAVVDDKFYVFGGQEGDYIAEPGDPDCRCTDNYTYERTHAETYRFDPNTRQWSRMADLAVPASHTDYSYLVFGKKVVLIGGQMHKDDVTKRVQLTDAIQAYDTMNDTWKIVGRLPYRLKACLAAHYEGYLYITLGQPIRGRMTLRRSTNSTGRCGGRDLRWNEIRMNSGGEVYAQRARAFGCGRGGGSFAGACCLFE